MSFLFIRVSVGFWWLCSSSFQEGFTEEEMFQNLKCCSQEPVWGEREKPLASLCPTVSLGSRWRSWLWSALPFSLIRQGQPPPPGLPSTLLEFVFELEGRLPCPASTEEGLTRSLVLQRIMVKS